MILDDIGRKQLGAFLKTIRTDAKITRKQLALAINNKSIQYIKMVELGLREPSVELCSAYCITTKYPRAAFSKQYGEFMTASLKRQIQAAGQL